MPYLIQPANDTGVIIPLRTAHDYTCAYCRRYIKPPAVVEVDANLEVPMICDYSGLTVYRIDLLEILWKYMKSYQNVCVVPVKNKEVYVREYFAVFADKTVICRYPARKIIDRCHPGIREIGDRSASPITCLSCGFTTVWGGDTEKKSKLNNIVWNQKLIFNTEYFPIVNDSIFAEINKKFGRALHFEEVDLIDIEEDLDTIDPNLPYGGWEKSWFEEHKLYYKCFSQSDIERYKSRGFVAVEELINACSGISIPIDIEALGAAYTRQRNLKVPVTWKPCIAFGELVPDSAAIAGAAARYGRLRIRQRESGEGLWELTILQISFSSLAANGIVSPMVPTTGALEVSLEMDGSSPSGRVRVEYLGSEQLGGAGADSAEGTEQSGEVHKDIVVLGARKALVCTWAQFREAYERSLSGQDDEASGARVATSGVGEADMLADYGASCEKRYWKQLRKGPWVQLGGPLMDLPLTSVGSSSRRGTLNLSMDIDGALFDIEFEGRLLLALPNLSKAGFGEVMPVGCHLLLNM